MTDDTLVTLLAGWRIGLVRRDRRNRLRFSYSDDWRDFRGAFPLSLSMPLAAVEHEHERTEAFLWGLLPDNEFVLERWARRFQVSARNAFALMSHVGEDCAGAVQFVRPGRIDAITSTQTAEISWLDETGIAERLRTLRADHAAWRLPRDTGQFSLAGAQPKTALLYQDGRWGVPSGHTPTTHILKPPTGEFDGHVENEHICLALARTMGLPAANSEVRRFDSEVAILIERYDRAYTSAVAAAAAAESAAKAAEAAMWAEKSDDPKAPEKAAGAAAESAAAAARAQGLVELAKTQPILRLHQEDMCQALGLMPTSKYQNEGGPSPEDIVALLRTHSSRPLEDVSTFIDGLAFNWLIAGTDAHAKNYSILHGAGGRVRLAPFYDIASALPYDSLDPLRVKLAMKIGGEYRLRDIGPRQWRKLATALRLDGDQVLGRIAAFASSLPEQLAVIRDQARGEGLAHPIIDRLTAAICHRAGQCRRLVEA